MLRRGRSTSLVTYTRTNNANASRSTTPRDLLISDLPVPSTAAYTLLSSPPLSTSRTMKVTVKRWHAIAQWQWDIGRTDEHGDAEEDVCGICRVPFEGCCPTCKVPGDDCPLSEWPVHHPYTHHRPC